MIVPKVNFNFLNNSPTGTNIPKPLDALKRVGDIGDIGLSYIEESKIYKKERGNSNK